MIHYDEASLVITWYTDSPLAVYHKAQQQLAYLRFRASIMHHLTN
jgi:hypothetical protein